MPLGVIIWNAFIQRGCGSSLNGGRLYIINAFIRVLGPVEVVVGRQIVVVVVTVVTVNAVVVYKFQVFSWESFSGDVAWIILHRGSKLSDQTAG